MTNKNFAFSLIEALVFVAILSLFFVTGSAVVTFSLRNMKINEHKILATRYSQELLEWLRGEREVDWNNFAMNKASTGGTVYCFNNNSIVWTTAGQSCSNYSLGTPALFKREAILTRSTGNNQVEVAITVEWQELGNTFSVPLNSIVSIWE